MDRACCRSREGRKALPDALHPERPVLYEVDDTDIFPNFVRSNAWNGKIPCTTTMPRHADGEDAEEGAG